MCQFMTITTDIRRLHVIANEYGQDIFDILSKKGGEYYSLVFSDGKSNTNFSFSTSQALIEELQKLSGKEPTKVVLSLFSRQAPEMEFGEVEEQPYIIENTIGAKKIEDVIMVHGTIYNDKELIELNNLKDSGHNIVVDTELFKFLDFDDPNIKGTFTSIKVDSELNITIRNQGLKYWSTSMVNYNGSIIGDVISSTFIEFDRGSDLYIDSKPEVDKRTLFAAFSGGMDISLSVAEALSTKQYDLLVLNYFDWGSNASSAEMQTLESFKDLYEELYDIEVQIDFIQSSEYFDAFFKINQADVKISDPDAEGDADETEEPIAYVPYRNTQFAMMLASIAETDKLKNIDIIFGLNLSEGMVFMDNAEPWLEAVNQIVKYGGSDFQITGTYRVIAPFFERTKTNMLLEFKERHGEDVFEKILNTSFSCYYPINGEQCGKCGSCILREKALQRI